MREDISGFRLPRYEQIPDVGLYLEQTVRYVNSFLAPLGEVELTASMASNYVKHKLLPAPRKKLYSAEQLARLMFIAAVKPVVPLDGLRLMFSIQAETMKSKLPTIISAMSLRICSVRHLELRLRCRELGKRSPTRRIFSAIR